MERIIVHTNWTNTISRRIELTPPDLLEPANLDILRQVFRGSDALRPGITPQELTRKVALAFGDLSRRLRARGHPPRAVAHFLNRLVFRLFAKMRTGGFFGAEVIAWFNGGLFDDAPPPPLERADLKLIADAAAEHDWSQIDPAIFGTLFEEALKATRQRAALGAHYTDRDKILKIVDPVITRPLAAEWDVAHAEIRLWIGDLHWMLKNGFVAYAEPILSTLDAIENRDALLNPDGTEAEWPAVDVIIGNPRSWAASACATAWATSRWSACSRPSATACRPKPTSSSIGS
jgi:type II restriction/modification system DNA methylase subunit YeeA